MVEKVGSRKFAVTAAVGAAATTGAVEECWQQAKDEGAALKGRPLVSMLMIDSIFRD